MKTISMTGKREPQRSLADADLFIDYVRFVVEGMCRRRPVGKRLSAGDARTWQLLDRGYRVAAKQILAVIDGTNTEAV